MTDLVWVILASCDDPAPPPDISFAEAAKRAYHDTSFRERRCDYCNEFYQGPAIYCCLRCALADA